MKHKAFKGLDGIISAPVNHTNLFHRPPFCTAACWSSKTWYGSQGPVNVLWFRSLGNLNILKVRSYQIAEP